MTWTLRARNADLSNGPVLSDWSGTLVERHNLPDTLQVNGRSDDLRDLFALDGGVTLSDDTGHRFTGELSSLTRNGDRTCSLTFESDLIRLWERICYPDPANPWATQTTDYDVQTSVPAETAMLHYIGVNAGPSAITGRRVTGLVVPSSLGRGGTVTITARFDVVGRLVADTAEAGALRVRVLQQNGSLVVAIDLAPDLSATARFGSPDAGGPGILDPSWSYTINKPDLTHAEVAGGGLGTARILRERFNLDAQLRWHRRVEALVDQNQTSDLAELDKAGDDELAQGSQPVQISAPILDSPDLPLGTAVPVGALVALNLDDELVIERLRELTTTIGAQPGQPSVTVSGVVGSPDAGLTRTQKDFLAMKKSLRRVEAR